MKSGLYSGRLIKWQDERGFGFIQSVNEDGEIFLHISELKDATRRPQVGDTIYYRVTVIEGKRRACNAFIAGARSKPTAQSSGGKALSNATSKPKFPVLEIFLLSIVPLIGAIHFTSKTGIPLPLILYPAMSFITFALYADDKSRAQQGVWRISEQTLHVCELAGGWIDGLIAQRRLCHKNRKQSYQIEFWSIVIIHQVAWLIWLFFHNIFIPN